MSEIRQLRFSFSRHMMSTVPKTESSEDFLPVFSARDEDGALAIMVAIQVGPSNDLVELCFPHIKLKPCVIFCCQERQIPTYYQSAVLYLLQLHKW